MEALDKRLNDSESTKKRVEESHKELKNALTDMQQSNLTLETANRSLAKEVEFLKEILRKFEAVREVATSEDPIPTSSENKPGDRNASFDPNPKFLTVYPGCSAEN